MKQCLPVSLKPTTIWTAMSLMLTKPHNIPQHGLWSSKKIIDHERTAESCNVSRGDNEYLANGPITTVGLTEMMKGNI